MSGLAQIKSILQRVITIKNFGQCLQKVKIISAGEGKCKAQITLAEEHLNIFGNLHGGFTSTIVDCVSSYALMSQGSGIAGVSVDLHVTFLKPAVLGETLMIDARTIRAGKTLAFLEVEITKNDGQVIVARGQHTKFMVS